MLKLLSVKILISSGSVGNTSAMAKPAPFGNDLPEGNATRLCKMCKTGMSHISSVL